MGGREGRERKEGERKVGLEERKGGREGKKEGKKEEVISEQTKEGKKLCFSYLSATLIEIDWA